MTDKIDPVFVSHAADVLGDTRRGLTGSEIAKKLRAYALRYEVNIPYPSTPNDAPNKRTMLNENLTAFSGWQQYEIIKDLCEDSRFSTFLGNDFEAVRELKLMLVTRYPQFRGSDVTGINEALVEETRHWLGEYPGSLQLYESALVKYEGGVFQRNVLDDLRLSLEILLQEVLSNGKSLENQKASLGGFLKARGGSKELSNMFVTLLDYYAKYQNSFVKHSDAVVEQEMELIFELSSSFMKHVVRLA